MINGLLYLTSAILVATRMPELSGRVASAAQARGQTAEHSPASSRCCATGLQFAAATPLVRGLVIGMIGAFAAAGVVIGTREAVRAESCSAATSTFGLLFVAVFVGLAIGMATAPQTGPAAAATTGCSASTIVLAGVAPDAGRALAAPVGRAARRRAGRRVCRRGVPDRPDDHRLAGRGRHARPDSR